MNVKIRTRVYNMPRIVRDALAHSGQSISRIVFSERTKPVDSVGVNTGIKILEDLYQEGVIGQVK